MATRTISDTGGNWGNVGTWVEGVVPTSSDDVVATVTSGLLNTGLVQRNCKSLNFTNYTATINTSTTGLVNVYGDVTFSAEMVCTGTGTIYMRSSSPSTLTTNDNPFLPNIRLGGNSTITVLGGPGGVISPAPGNTLKPEGSTNVVISNTTIILDNLIAATDYTGTFDFTNSDLTLGGFNLYGGTPIATGSTIRLGNAGNGLFYGGGFSYPYVKVISNVAGGWHFYGNNTFGTLHLEDPNGPYYFEAGSTTEFLTDLIADGYAFGDLGMTLASDATGVRFNFTKTGGQVVVRRLHLVDCNAQGTAKWYAQDCYEVTNSSGWTLGAPGTPTAYPLPTYFRPV